jgi:large subunit ribosomal protein L23
MIDLVKYFVSTQKAVRLRERQQYVLDVDIKLTKPQIKKLIETMYSVKVVAVNTHIPPRKKKRLGPVGASLGWKATFKRAIITLKPGQKIIVTKEDDD